MRSGPLMALAALVTALAAAPHPASAQSIAYSVPGTTNVRAGPGTQYPVVARVRGGVEIFVYGCLSDRAWCDVLVYETRGWMSSRRLEFVYAGSRVPVPEYYAYFSAPIIGFDFGYWDRYYVDRPFYRRWRRDRPPHNRPPDDDDVTNWPGIEHPGGTADYRRRPPRGGYEDPGQPPSLGGGYERPGRSDDFGGGYEQPGGGNVGGGNCPPGIVCP